MAPVAEPGLLQGLPSLAALRSESGRSDAFADLRGWVKRTQREGRLQHAGRALSAQHRHAIFRFLQQESEPGNLRKGRAREVTAALAELQEFAVGVLDEQGCVGMEVPEETRPLVHLIEEPTDCGLPGHAELANAEAVSGELFQKLRAWIRVQRKAGRLEDTGLRLSEDYRRDVFGFLCAVAARKPVLRSQANEMLRQLAASEAWRAGDVVDLALLEGVCVPLEAPPKPAQGTYPWHCPDSKVQVPVPRSRKWRMSRGVVVTRAGKSDWSDDDVAVGLRRRQAPECSEPPPDERLPSKAQLQDPSADSREVFQELRAWVRALRQEGRFEASSRVLDEEYRRIIVAFLCAFCDRKSVFRLQAQEMLQRLAASQAWQRGGVFDEAPLEAARSAGAKPGKAEKAEACSETSSTGSGSPQEPLFVAAGGC